MIPVSVVTENSGFISLLNKIGGRASVFTRLLGRIYTESRIYRAICGLSAKLKFYSKSSFLMAVTDLRQEGNIAIVSESRVVSRLVNSYKKAEQKVLLYLKYSQDNLLCAQLKKDFHSSPIKTVGAITMTAIMINMILSVIFKKEIGLLGWSMRVLIVFIGIHGLGSDTDWPTLKSGSITLRMILGKKCAGSAER